MLFVRLLAAPTCGGRARARQRSWSPRGRGGWRPRQRSRKPITSDETLPASGTNSRRETTVAAHAELVLQHRRSDATQVHGTRSAGRDRGMTGTP
jgi:hypothetical protein